MPQITIDGKAIDFVNGLTILDCAKKAGIYIPTLCSYSGLSPYGACRLCIVEIEGVRGLVASCTRAAEDGMVVRTNTDEIKKIRLGILELILSEHPTACLFCEKKDECKKYGSCLKSSVITTGCRFCPKDGRCELQDLVKNLGLKEMTIPTLYKFLPVEKDEPFYERDYNLCVLCGRCIRTCQEVRGVGAVSLTKRGKDTACGTAFGLSHREVSCKFCGACVDACPSGALYDRSSKLFGTPDVICQSICPYCSIGCKINLEVKRGKISRSTPRDNLLCARGRFGVIGLVYKDSRLLTSLVKDNEKTKEVGLQEAINFISARLKNYSGSEIALLVSPNLTNEDVFVARKFAREVLKSENVILFSNTRWQENVPSDMLCVLQNIDGGRDIFERGALIGEGNLQGALQMLGQNFRSFEEFLDDKNIKAIYSIGVPILRRDKKFDFAIVQDAYPFDLLKEADVYLPSAVFAEIDGTYTNLFGKEQDIKRAIEPPPQAKPDWKIICEIAKGVGASGFDLRDVSEIRKEITSEISRTGELPSKKYQKMEFVVPDGKDKDRLLLLDIGDLHYSYKGFDLAKFTKGFRTIDNVECIAISSSYSRKFGFEEGEEVSVVSAYGRIDKKIKISENISDKRAFVQLCLGENSPLNLVPLTRRDTQIFVAIEKKI